LKVECLMLESFPNPDRNSVPSKNFLKWDEPQVFSGTSALPIKLTILTIKRNDGSLSHDAFVGENQSFLKFAEDLFMHEWEKAKPWHP
jgi:hypothetical protein